MHREVVLSGIGGQGVQLAAKTLAMAATAEGRQVMMSSHYGGEMRGGQTEASVVVAEGELRCVPILESTWSAYVMHPRYWPGVAARLRPGGVVVWNRVGADGLDGLDAYRSFGVDAAGLAEGVGAPMAAGFVLLGAYAALTEMARVESLVAAMKQLVPPYRAERVAANEAALRAGAAAVTPAGATAGPVIPAGATAGPAIPAGA